ncbi:GIY-YIG nuclease family protein [Mesorhizobium sp. WSM4303]|uniref:GIY-YIG nuclease family protein n=1 Tax=Mesorhizobium sp. WSM4303 TaxID=2589887 RepID=UPI00115E67C0|nr:GIY-YIG nuclease family protein [Mesorhizobium sp. WSM4303]TRD03785.1 GIY-YIG nuclease family protein [Mesorhizobium sp. WSM4303]
MTSYFEQRIAEIKATPALTMTPPVKREPKPIPPLGTKKGYIYFITAGNLEHVKIGFATDIGSRLNSLSTGNREEIQVQEYFYSHREAEKLLHRHFAKERLRGEWFNLTDDIEELWDDIMDYQGSHWVGDDGEAVAEEITDVYIPLDHLQKILDYLHKPWPKGLFA